MDKFKDSKYFLPIIILILIPFLDLAGILFINSLRSPQLQPQTSNIQAEDQMAAVSSQKSSGISLGSLLGCVVLPVNLTVANTQANPIIIPVRSSACNNLLPANATSSNILLTGGWDIVQGQFIGRDGRVYTHQAVAHNEWIPYSVDNRYPFGHYKFFFKDPSISGSATPSGSGSLQVVFAQLPRFSTSNYYQVTQTIRDEVSGSVLGTANKNVYYVNYSQNPLIRFTYKPVMAQLFAGLKAKEKIYDFNGNLLYENDAAINSSGNTISFTPATTIKPGQIYTVRICPAQSNGVLVEKATCSVSVFITEDDLII